MKAHIALLLVISIGAASSPAAVDLKQAQALCQERRDDKGGVWAAYKFDPEVDLHISPAEQAIRRGKEAAEAWREFPRSVEPIPLLARSPYGGGETSESYWPADVSPELLRSLVEPLGKVGVKVVLPDLPAEPAEGNVKADQADAEPPKPWPKLGFSEDYEFALVVGLHHEPIPYLGTRRTADGKPIYSRGSRVNAWAILFHCPTGTAFWGTTAMVRVGHRGVGDPLNLAAETVLGYLDFSEIGTDNIPAHVDKLPEVLGANTVDLAAMLVQSQRADAIAALVKLSVNIPVYRAKVRVLRYFNERGTAQDYRLDGEQLKRRRCVYAAQEVTLRILLMEQLRGIRGVQACGIAALVQKHQDFEIGPLGQLHAGRTPPLNPDDEIVLIGELAHSNRRAIFRRNYVSSVRNLGHCRAYIAEAMAVAQFYADRKPPPPPKGKKPRRDPLKEAAQAALRQLRQTRVELDKNRASREAG